MYGQVKIGIPCAECGSTENEYQVDFLIEKHRDKTISLVSYRIDPKNKVCIDCLYKGWGKKEE